MNIDMNIDMNIGMNIDMNILKETVFFFSKTVKSISRK